MKTHKAGVVAEGRVLSNVPVSNACASCGDEQALCRPIVSLSVRIMSIWTKRRFSEAPEITIWIGFDG